MRVRLLIFGLLLFGCDVERKDNIRLVYQAPVSTTAPAGVVTEPKPVSHGGRVVPPRPIKRVGPVFPERPQADIRFIAVEALVSAQGDVTRVKIIRGGDSAYTRAVAAALKKWKFHPGTIDGKPADMTHQLTARIDVH